MNASQNVVRYVLTRDIEAQRIHLQALFLLQLPTWRPGRYELGNFAQYVLWVEGIDQEGRRGSPVMDGSCRRVWNGCLTRMRVRRALNRTLLRQSRQLFHVRPGMLTWFWPTSLNPELEGGRHLLWPCPGTTMETPCMQARDVQHLMDSPWMASPKLWHDSYREQGLDVHLWVHDTLPSDLDRFVADHVAFTRAQLSTFGTFPVDEYHFLYLFPDRDVRHGVEHEDSTVIAIGPAERRSEEGYMEILGIASHELYHAWNVKRIRPAEWTPYDFTGPCPSELGYVAEGVTTYMGDLFLFESGIVDLKGWCALMTKLLERHLNNPGRLNMSVAASSYDTWLDGYRLGVPGRKGSIYVEGAVLAFLCDTRIMERTDGKSSLSTAMRLLWERLGKPRIGLTADVYWDVLAEVAGERLDDLRRDHADGAKDTWDALVHAMSTQGLTLTQSKDEKGLTRVTIQ